MITIFCTKSPELSRRESNGFLILTKVLIAGCRAKPS